MYLTIVGEGHLGVGKKVCAQVKVKVNRIASFIRE